MRVCNVNIYVSDLDFAIEWYDEVLGLKVASKKNYPTSVFLQQDSDTRLVLHKAEKDTEIDIWKQSATILTFEEQNLREKMKKLKERGVIMMNDEPQWFPDGERIAFKDPFGNVHELAEMRSENKK
ncbi:VOC family protein [Pontibacillus sp. HMF3514]|uniref:VOC family protein n=1 Tax=Pontibacillus sp. HMF3514 TaxID=2692425 RepID=UPI00131F8E1F|nr:VOC family protein [Pontibacillus sp. HMF3514]QHE53382.1 hypothetical protein GS400_15760 [Pontibacillus sp. HMF3514]